MRNLKIAVIGKSSAGKSAFIKSFSSMPEYINSVGKGQTTRSYAEYLFISNYNDNYPYVEAEIVTSTVFCENRLLQVLNRVKSDINGFKLENIEIFKKQFENKTYKKRIQEIMLYANDFFNIKEFGFIDEGIIAWSDNEFEKFVLKVLECTEKTDEEYEEDKKANDEKETKLEAELKRFFKSIYDRIIESIKSYYKESKLLNFDNNLMIFRFRVDDDESKKMFSCLLKVDEDTKQSLTGVVSKVRVRSGINREYEEILKKLDLDNISFVDTYGLDHSDNISKEMLSERYHRIFNKDYPDISAVFLVEALHAGASNEFRSAITMLYETKPEIMTYVIGTYIDENEKELFENEEWLFSEDKKQYEAPHLNGKVQDIMQNDTNLLAKLLDQGISESMAEKRCDVMRKRFAPFCGDLSQTTGEIDYKKVNMVSIKALLTSIVEQEHLGDGYIQIDQILEKISRKDILEKFSNQFIENVKQRFIEVYELSANRTRWKIRENLEEYILGFNGTTLDATWRRVFRDAFNLTFTKQIQIDGRDQMLSDVLGIEGNSKIAFDEILATISPFLFRRECKDEEYIDAYIDEVYCAECAEGRRNADNCIWNIFMNGATYEAFRDRNKYNRVIDWLKELHSFSSMDCLNEKITKQLGDIMNRYLVPLCRHHNMRIASKNIKGAKGPYIDSKEEEFKNYKAAYDNKIERAFFNREVNEFLSIL